MIAKILAALLLAGFVLHYAWWIAAIGALVIAGRYALAALRRHQAQAATVTENRRQLAARADQQHRWAILGDARGTFGEYPPAA